MKRPVLLVLVLSSSMSMSSIALADLAPEPCDDKAEGDACITTLDEVGTCVLPDCPSGSGGCGNFLECQPDTGTGGNGGGGNAGGAPATGGSGTGNVAEDGGGEDPPADDGCSLKSGGTQRGASTFAVLAALGLGAWISRRRNK